MQVKQIYEILNTIKGETIGESVVVNEDLSNIVELGKAFENLENGYDNFVRRLHDHIGRVVFVNRTYRGRAPSVYMDSWEYGSIMEKIRMELPDAEINETWDLKDRESYDPNIFYAPSISAKFFNKRVTYEIPISRTERQVRSAFSSASQMNGLMSLIENTVQNAMTLNIDNLVMRTINAAIGETFASEFPSGTYTGVSGVRAVNLLHLYNQTVSSADQISDASTAIRTPSFIRFAVQIMGNYVDRLEVMSTLFNGGKTEKFTPRDRLHILLLSEFKRGADVYLQSDVFNDEFTRLPSGESIVYWQGSGIDYGFASTSAINVKTPSGTEVSASGVLGVMFDRDALGVTNLDRRITSNWNPKAEFWTNFHKFDAGYFLDMDENFVVFYAA